MAAKVLLELKSVERVTPAHKKQVQTYLRLTSMKLGHLLNFGETVLKDGITRCVNRLEEDVPPGNIAQRRGDAENPTSPSPSPRLRASAGDSAE